MADSHIWLQMSDVNPLMGTGNYSATSNNMKLVHWPLMGGLLHLVQRGGARACCGPAQCVPNVTAHPSTASVPITVLLCRFNVAIKWLTCYCWCCRCITLSMQLVSLGTQLIRNKTSYSERPKQSRYQQVACCLNFDEHSTGTRFRGIIM